MKNFNRKSLLAVISPFLVLSMASCQEKGEQAESSSITSSEIKVTAIEIEGKSTVGLKEYITLVAKANDVEQKVKWSTSNSSVATISTTGVVKGISKGTVTITAVLKTDETISDTFEVTVADSSQIGKVFDRFETSKYYQVTGTGNINTTLVSGSINFTEDHFSDSYLFTSTTDVCLPTYGLGVTKNGAYTYNVENSQVTSATYLRDIYTDLNDVFVDLTDLQYVGNFSNVTLEDDGVYESTNTTLMAVFFYIWSQNFNITSKQYDTLQETLAYVMTGITITVVSPYEFNVALNFSSLVTNATLTFSHLNEDKTNTMLTAYLKSNEVAYPAVYDDITKLKALADTHNYYRDLGYYKFEDTKKDPIHIGRGYFTENYVYLHYEDAYIEEVKNTTTLFDHGYINIKDKKGYEDGVYYFTYKVETEGGEKEFKLTRFTEVDYQGYYYTHWYDFYENLSLILEYMSGYEYTFAAASIEDSDYPESKFNIYLSTCTAAQRVCQDAFEEYIEGLSANPTGFIFAINLDEENSANSVINYAGYMAVSGSEGCVFSGYNYTGFGQGNSELIDNFLNSLEDK